VNIGQKYEQERGCLMHFVHVANALLKHEENARDETITFLQVTLPNIHWFKKIRWQTQQQTFLNNSTTP